MNYNNQYEHITVKISSLNLSLIPIYKIRYILFKVSPCFFTYNDIYTKQVTHMEL